MGTCLFLGCSPVCYSFSGSFSQPDSRLLWFWIVFEVVEGVKKKFFFGWWKIFTQLPSNQLQFSFRPSPDTLKSCQPSSLPQPCNHSVPFLCVMAFICSKPVDGFSSTFCDSRNSVLSSLRYRSCHCASVP